MHTPGMCDFTTENRYEIEQEDQKKENPHVSRKGKEETKNTEGKTGPDQETGGQVEGTVIQINSRTVRMNRGHIQ